MKEEELKWEELKEMDIRMNTLCYKWQRQEERIKELEKENEELKDKNKALELYADLADEKVDQLKQENAELKKAVEHYRKEREFFIGELEND